MQMIPDEFIHEDGSIMAVKDYPIVKILESKKAINNSIR
jgi:hypothetical protein